MPAGVRCEQKPRYPVLIDMSGVSMLTAVLAGFGRTISEVGAILIVGGNIAGYTRTMTTAVALETSKGNHPWRSCSGVGSDRAQHLDQRPSLLRAAAPFTALGNVMLMVWRAPRASCCSPWHRPRTPPARRRNRSSWPQPHRWTIRGCSKTSCRGSRRRRTYRSRSWHKAPDRLSIQRGVAMPTWCWCMIPRRKRSSSRRGTGSIDDKSPGTTSSSLASQG